MNGFRGFLHKTASISFGLIPAAFLLALAPGTSPVNAEPVPQDLRMSCDSNDFHRRVCVVDTTGGVVMIHQKSEAKCIQNTTWGYDKNGIWVDRGCRAEFQIHIQAPVVEHREHDRDHDRDYDRDRDPNHDNRRESAYRAPDNEFRGWGESYLVYCSSDDMQRVWCPADARFGVRLIRQRSQATCIEGQTWGYGKRGIWADRGCRADFVVTGDWQSRAAALIYCPSDYMNLNSCPIDTRDGVFIVRQRSQSDCVFNRTWGYDRDHIWVDRGCRADFEIVDRRDEEWRDWSRDWDDDDRRGWDRYRFRGRDRDDRPDRDHDDRPRDDRPDPDDPASN